MTNGSTDVPEALPWRVRRAELDIQQLDKDKADKQQVDRIETALNRLTVAIITAMTGGAIVVLGFLLQK